MKVSAYVHNFAGSYVAIAVVAGIKVTATGASESEVIDALAFKILDSTEPKFVELDLAAYARMRHVPAGSPHPHPLELAHQALEMRAKGLSNWQISIKLNASIAYLDHLIEVANNLAPEARQAIFPSTPKEPSK